MIIYLKLHGYNRELYKMNKNKKLINKVFVW